MGAILSGLNKTVNKKSETITETSVDTDYPLATNSNTKLVLSYSMTVVYLLLTIIIIMSCITLGLSYQAVSFLSLALIYSSITISVSSNSSFFMLVEIITWTALIELLDQLDFETIAWCLVFVAPITCLVQSLYYLMFYLI